MFLLSDWVCFVFVLSLYCVCIVLVLFLFCFCFVFVGLVVSPVLLSDYEKNIVSLAILVFLV